MNLLALIPHYNHPSTVGSVAHALRDFDLDVLIVDDGSREDCRPVLQNLQADGIRVLFRERNGGKGAAVKTGLQYAAEHGYTHVLQVDADGQHNLADTPQFIAAAQRQPENVICGEPQYGDDAPSKTACAAFGSIRWRQPLPWCAKSGWATAWILTPRFWCACIGAA